jgi:copper transport protein
MRRVLVLLALTALWAPGRADAHALVASSEPADGASLETAPSAVTITFTEQPDPKLSVVHVLDPSGRAVEGGPAEAVQPKQLRVPLRPLDNGVYTVTWRTLSKVDGHVTGGAFAFGVGTIPIGGPIARAPRTPPPSPLSVVGKWAFYFGVVLLVGAAWTSWLAFPAPPRSALRLVGAAWTAAAAGLVMLGLAQLQTAGSGLGDAVRSSLGRGLLLRAVPLAVAGIAIPAATGKRQRRAALAVIAIAAVGVIVAHVGSGHAATGGLRWAKIATQAAHFTAAGVWIGGLAALVAGVRGAPEAAKAQAVRRFSAVAGVALAVIGVTGVARAWNEVGAWSRLGSTSFGRVVALKVALFVPLAVLGAANRYRNVPRAEQTLHGLRRLGRWEIGLAAVVLAATALLTGLPPSAFVRAAPRAVRPVTALGSDVGTTMRARLEVTPGLPGPNRFVVRLADYDTREPVSASRVALRFSFPARPDVGGSVLELAPSKRGTFSATGSHMSLTGRWSVTVVVERAVNSAEIPLRVATKVPPQRTTALRTQGQPTIYSVDLGSGRQAQVYLDPERAGSSEMHVTFFDRGDELPVGDETAIVATQPSGTAHALEARRFGPGHFVASVDLVSGRWTFDVTAPAAAGGTVRARVTITIR